MTLFALSCIVTAVLTAIVCVVLLFNDIKNRTNRAWFYTTLSVLAWTIGLYGTVTVQDSYQALFWQRILYIGTICAPIFFFRFCLNLLERKSRYALFIGEVLAVVFLISIFSKLFIAGIDGRDSFGYWPVLVGPLYYPFLLYFIFYVVYSIALLKIDTKKHDGIYQKQIQYVYYTALIGFIGSSTNFLLDSNLNPYSFSFGNYFVILYVVFITYATLKHQLFNIKVIATELFTLVLWIILFIRIILSDSAQDLATNIAVFAAVAIVGILLVRSVIKEVIQREKIEKIGKELERAYVVEKKANMELQNLDKYKNDFLRQTQHDLKNPLTVIMGYSDLLISGNLGRVPKKAVEILKRMQVVAQDKIRDVNNFLDTEQFKMGKRVVSLKPGVQLAPILKEVIERLSYQAELKGVCLRLEAPENIPAISADREKLKSAIFNIIDNSVKYTQKGGVNIKVESNNAVKIIVADTGIGIPQDKINTLLETQFERTKQAEKMASGSGVGLHLSAQIIKLHNGKIWVESAGEGKGSTFYIELPLG